MPTLPRRLAITALLLLPLSLPACISKPAAPPEHRPTAAPIAPAPWRQTSLYFGLNRRDGRAVSELEWTSFVEQSLTPQFPQGFTVYLADGQWRDAQGVVQRESSRVVVLLYETATAHEVDPKLTQVAAEYISRFDQEAVMRVDTPAMAQFLREPAKPSTR
jgi:hypothetical protein